eukprot:CAMPEP_0178400356 /NCGR_PEP_ID=MMETSP0689_2-20121128/15748_1 /TAXON_ID=160604 /ORGANISM="Amphidinium massartii, Strain CS-259" /LENGTH=736 /DNA_ID=CAMNT_0020021151 /DNA_START=81 /DNA_END=2291 /DNA_ORIENTATION=+
MAAAMVHSPSVQLDHGNVHSDMLPCSLQHDPSHQQEQAAKDFARSKLQAAVASRHCAALADAIASGRRCGLESDLLQRAQTLLEQLEEVHLLKQQYKEEAERKLRTAIASRQAADLRSALDAGWEAKAEADLLNEAHMALAQAEARRRTALQRLEFAVQTRDLPRLQDALCTAHAEAIDEQDSELLHEAQRLVLEEQAKVKLEALISAAKQSGDEPQLQAAISEARSRGLTSKTISRGEEWLARLKAKAEASESLQALLRDSQDPDADELRAAIHEARRAESDVTLLNDAYLKLARLENEGAPASGSGQAAKSSSREDDDESTDPQSSCTEEQGHSEIAQGEAATDAAEGDGEGVLAAAIESLHDHCLQQHGGRVARVPEGAPGSDPLPVQPQSEISTPEMYSDTESPSKAASTSAVKKAKCPTCGELLRLDTAEEAREHWSQKHQEKQTVEEVRASKQEVPGATTVACDETGKPVVVRKVDAETGAAHTTVLGQDGVEKKFGEKTVLSMAAKQEAVVQLWLQNMTDIEIRGLCHEVTQRVVEGSQRYHSKRARLQQLSCRCNLLYFGLPADATEKELDAKYRRMARSLHPDKHGGSEEAKERFQTMKARYEAVKKTFAAAKGGNSKSREEDEGNDPKSQSEEAASPTSADQRNSENEQASAESRHREAYDEDDDVEAAEPTTPEEDGIKCDFGSRKSTMETLWDMVRQIKNIQTQEADLDAQLQQFERGTPSSSS